MLAVDTSVLLSIFKGEADGEAWLRRLESEAALRPLIACTVVWAEIRAFFTDESSCQESFAALGIAYSGIEESSALLAGEIFRGYRQQGGPRAVMLPDFLVAAHAVSQAAALATTDRGYFRRYFPKLNLLTSPA